MGFTFINKLPTPAEIREQFPLAPELAEIKHARDEEIKRYLPVRATSSLSSSVPVLLTTRNLYVITPDAL